jgi:hypothetical protein
MRRLCQGPHLRRFSHRVGFEYARQIRGLAGRAYSATQRLKRDVLASSPSLHRTWTSAPGYRGEYRGENGYMMSPPQPPLNLNPQAMPLPSDAAECYGLNPEATSAYNVCQNFEQHATNDTND